MSLDLDQTFKVIDEVVDATKSAKKTTGNTITKGINVAKDVGQKIADYPEVVGDAAYNIFLADPGSERLSPEQKREFAAKQAKEAAAKQAAIDKNTPLNGNSGKEYRDGEWIRQVLFIPQNISDSIVNSRASSIRKNRQYTTGMLNFSDTTLGGNRSINPLPQFTEFADQNIDSILRGVSAGSEIHRNSGRNTANGGMGRYYYEAIDTNAQRIFMDFGIPKYNSLGTFFSSYYDSDMGAMVNRGVSKSILTTAIEVAGFALFWWIIIPVKIAHNVSEVINFLTRVSSSKYYYMQPAMDTYWATVSTLVSDMCVNMGLLPEYDPMKDSEDRSQRQTAENENKSSFYDGQIDKGTLESFRRLVPDIFEPDSGTIHALRVATRFQRMSDAHRTRLEDITKNTTTNEQAMNAILTFLKENQSSRPDQPLTQKAIAEYVETFKKMNDFRIENDAKFGSATGDDGSVSETAAEPERIKAAEAEIEKLKTEGKTAEAEAAQKTLNDYKAAQANKTAAKQGTENANDEAARRQHETNAGVEGTTGDGEDTSKTDSVINFIFGMKEHYTAMRRDGMAFVSFAVEYETGISESISNSTSPSSIAETMNSATSANKSMIFNMAGGNIGSNPIANAAETILGGVKSLVQGGLNFVGLQGLSAVGGAAYVDIPDFWSNSDTSLPDASYTIQLRSPYGNPMSLLINVYFPLMMLLAGALPRSTGPSSYSAPFLCRLWHKGRHQISLGLITSINISRGTSNIAWNPRDQAVAIDVTFTVKNLSKMLHMPITNTTSFVKGYFGVKNLFDEPTNFTDYMAVLAGLGLVEQHYIIPNLIRRHHLSASRWQATYTPLRVASWFNSSTKIGQFISAVSIPTEI